MPTEGVVVGQTWPFNCSRRVYALWICRGAFLVLFTRNEPNKNVGNFPKPSDRIVFQKSLSGTHRRSKKKKKITTNHTGVRRAIYVSNVLVGFQNGEMLNFLCQVYLIQHTLFRLRQRFTLNTVSAFVFWLQYLNRNSTRVIRFTA